MILTSYTNMRDVVSHEPKSQQLVSCNKELKLERSITRETQNQNGNELNTSNDIMFNKQTNATLGKKNQKDEFTESLLSIYFILSDEFTAFNRAGACKNLLKKRLGL